MQWNGIYPRDDFRPKNITFTGNVEILESLPRNATAEDYFKLYIDDKMIDYILTQTKLYAEQYFEKEQGNLRPHSLVHEWKLTDRAEMSTLLAILIFMGIIHKPRLTMYWSKDSILPKPIFNQVMRKDRFLLRFLYFADNTQYNPADSDRDKLYKLRSVIKMIKDRCCRLYSPGKCLSMDESLVLFKGRLSFKQYISTKRARFGIKLYQLCTSNGILLDFLVYHGNLAPGLTIMEDGCLMTERIPVTLMQKYLQKGHHLFIENYYTSMSLATYFHKMVLTLLGPSGIQENIFQLN